MKRIISLLVLSFSICSLTLAQNKQKSPASETKGKIGETEIIINYSSPSIRGRVIYGELVPFGKIWRAGANNATTIEFSKNVKVEGKDIPAGKYAFFVTPQKDKEWTLIFNSVHEQWGAYDYDASKDVLKVKVKPTSIDPVESLTYSIDESQVNLDWASTRVSFSVE